MKGDKLNGKRGEETGSSVSPEKKERKNLGLYLVVYSFFLPFAKKGIFEKKAPLPVFSLLRNVFLFLSIFRSAPLDPY